MGLVPAVGRWAQRWRARVVTRLGNHADLASPLAAKIAAGAIAFSVVGGAVATANSAPPAPAPAPPPSTVRVQTTPTSASPSPTPTPAAPVTSAGATPPRPPAASAPTAQAPAPPAPPTVAGGRFMTAGEADKEGAGSPIAAQVPGVAGASVDPKALVAGIMPVPKGGS